MDTGFQLGCLSSCPSLRQPGLSRFPTSFAHVLSSLLRSGLGSSAGSSPRGHTGPQSRAVEAGRGPMDGVSRVCLCSHRWGFKLHAQSICLRGGSLYLSLLTYFLGWGGGDVLPPINSGGGGEGSAQVDGDGYACRERGGPTAHGETDLPQASDRQLICWGRGREEWGSEPPICLRRQKHAHLCTWVWPALLSGLPEPAGPRPEEPLGRLGTVGEAVGIPGRPQQKGRASRAWGPVAGAQPRPLAQSCG